MRSLAQSRVGGRKEFVSGRCHEGP
jgi:hypothetical protein